jgi:Uma2 family endonuclease
MRLQDFQRANWREGYKYELIDGRVYVSPLADLPHEDAIDWIARKLRTYADSRPDVINRVATPARVFVPDRPLTTAPEPDLAAYRDYPWKLTRWRRSWKDVSPVLVVEVASGDIAKDFGRNVMLYEDVPTIREYWLMHEAGCERRLLFRVYRRRGARWQKPIDLKLGDTYTTRLLPGFSLPINPDA